MQPMQQKRFWWVFIFTMSNLVEKESSERRLSSSKNYIKQYKCILKIEHMFHCMIHHRQDLANKHLCNELNETLKTVVKIVSFIKPRPVNKQIFAELTWRWGVPDTPSYRSALAIKGPSVSLFYWTYEENIKEFLRLINQKMLDGMTNEFLFRTSFLSDIFSLYETNKCMQSTDANKLECKEIVDAFVRKVEIRNWWNRM